MAWRRADDGRIGYIGRLADWMSMFDSWFDEDIGKPHNPEDFGLYVTGLVLTISNLARDKWQKAFLGQGKIKQLDAIMRSPSGGYNKVNTELLYDMADYLAENLSLEQLRAWSSQARAAAKGVVQQYNEHA